jgi:hypothetical protein
MDLSNFLVDRVNHDRLMNRLATRIKDKRVLKVIRQYLRSGVMIGGTGKDPNSCQKHETLQEQGQGTDLPQAG